MHVYLRHFFYFSCFVILNCSISIKVKEREIQHSCSIILVDVPDSMNKNTVLVISELDYLAMLWYKMRKHLHWHRWKEKPSPNSLKHFRSAGTGQVRHKINILLVQYLCCAADLELAAIATHIPFQDVKPGIGVCLEIPRTSFLTNIIQKQLYLSKKVYFVTCLFKHLKI